MHLQPQAQLQSDADFFLKSERRAASTLANDVIEAAGATLEEHAAFPLLSVDDDAKAAQVA